MCQLYNIYAVFVKKETLLSFSSIKWLMMKVYIKPYFKAFILLTMQLFLFAFSNKLVAAFILTIIASRTTAGPYAALKWGGSNLKILLINIHRNVLIKHVSAL